jgi:hypothetical protein
MPQPTPPSERKDQETEQANKEVKKGDAKLPEAPLPEGNGATGKPAAFPPHN